MFYNCKQQSDPELGNLQATGLWTVCKMVLRGKYICNYKLKNLSNSALGFGAVSSCCWDSWGLCPSCVLPPSSSTQSSSQLSSCGQQLTLATGCLLTGEAAPNCCWIWTGDIFFFSGKWTGFVPMVFAECWQTTPYFSILPACLRWCSLEMCFSPFKAFDVFSHVRKIKKAAYKAGWGQWVLLGAAALILGGSFAINLIMHLSSLAPCVRVLCKGCRH